MKTLDKKKFGAKAVFFVVFVLFVAFYYWYHARVILSSDSTTMLPVALDWLHGNFILSDWILGTNNFFFTETIFYIFGLVLNVPYYKVLFFVPAVTYTAIIYLMLWVFVWKNVSIAEDKWRKVGISLIYTAIVGVICHQTAYSLLNANSHNGLYVFIILEFWLAEQYFEKKDKRNLRLYIFIGSLMMFSDSVTLMTMIAPMGGMCLYYICRNRQDKKRQKEYVDVIWGTLGLWFVAKVLTIFVENAGGLITVGTELHLVLSPGNIAQRIMAYKEHILLMWGYNAGFQTNMVGSIYNIIVLLVLVITAIAFLYGLYGILNGMIERRELFLWLVIFFNIVGCMFTDSQVFYRYLVPSYLFGTVYMLIVVAGWIKRLKKKAIILGTFVTLIICTVLPYTRISAIVGVADQMADSKEVARILEEEQLGDGYGDFWSSSVNACFTNYQNNIYPVWINEGKLVPYTELIKNSWYQEKDIHYVILNADESKNNFYKKVDICGMLGEPDKTYNAGSYDILYWVEDISEYLATN